jgi:drug/metabolite transporter (DMT)-like permease
MIAPGIVLGIGSAASFGAGDFFGGMATRRARGILVAGGSQLVGALALLVLLAVVRPALPDASALWIGAAAGTLGGIGVAALYRALSMGSMGLVAGISGIGSVLVPLGFDVFVARAPIGPWQVVGVLCAGAAGLAAGGAVRQGVSGRAVGLAVLAAIAFGGWYVLLDLGAQQGPIWALVGSRWSSSALMAVLVLISARGTVGPSVARTWPLILCSGLLDVGGNGLFVVSSAQISVGLAAALSGIYPLGTMLLARIVLRESLPPLGMLAVALALAGVVLISLG